MKKICTLLFFLVIVFSSVGQNNYQYRVFLSDKQGTSGRLDLPQLLLSPRALERRERLRIPLDSADLPLSAHYLKEISALGVRVISSSRWMNTVVVSTSDTSFASLIRKLPFVKQVQLVWDRAALQKIKKWGEIPSSKTLLETVPADYGAGYRQIEMLNGELLHQAGFRGEGIHIAVIDAPFNRVTSVKAIAKESILGIKDFAYPPEDIIQHSETHGRFVTAIMAANQKNLLIGSAPEASYWLLRSEVPGVEYPVEEDYWLAAAEFADSVGVEVINTSLGYFKFDIPSMDYTYADMNGKTAFVSRGATIAVNKGISVVAAMGNEGTTRWYYLTAPADAKGVISVGSVTAGGNVSNFSSRGPTSDRRTKPDVLAQGEQTISLAPENNLAKIDGTSFACPIVAGLTACLRQAFPFVHPVNLATYIAQKGENYNSPSFERGYGISDFYAVYLHLLTDAKEIPSEEILFFFARGDKTLHRQGELGGHQGRLVVFDLTGKLVLSQNIDKQESTWDLSFLPAGTYIASITDGRNQKSLKIIL